MGRNILMFDVWSLQNPEIQIPSEKWILPENGVTANDRDFYSRYALYIVGMQKKHLHQQMTANK